MKLVDEIVQLLSDENASLTAALLKTKVLLFKIGQKDLAEWVNRELNGYSDEDAIPAYRVLPAQVLANVANAAYQFNSHPIPIGHLSESRRKSLENSEMRQSLAVLEKLVSGGKPSGSLSGTIPMEWNGVLGKSLSPGMRIQKAWCEIGVPSISGIFIQVRSRLLDFLLELNDQLPGDIDDSQVKQRVEKINTHAIFKGAIFGDNTTIVVGTANSPIVTNTSLVGNIDALAEELRKQGVSAGQIESLRVAIAEDEGKTTEASKQFGPAVRGWLDSLVINSASISGQIELAIVANIITTKLQAFYGWLS